jgi:transposase
MNFMRSLQVVNHLDNTEVQKNLMDSRGSVNHPRWQIIYLIQIGNIHTADLLAPLVGLSVHSIYKIVENYNRIGAAALICKPKGGRKRALLSLEDEAALFLSLESLASKGMVKTANDIRNVVEGRIGKPVSDDYLWDLLHRNGWKKKMPRPHHPKRNLEQQAEFKKNSPKSWQPLQ